VDLEKAWLERNKQTVTAFYNTFMSDHDPEGDFVVVHVHHLSSTGGKGRASMDWFRLDSDGKIVEHWDVMQWVPEDKKVLNRNTIF
jgi:predicted SnoaL-like aldol condensation-catalyzing enzyme